MNNDPREQLSAYLDGALPDAQRAQMEALLQNSPDLRRELEALRAVSSTIKGLPHEGLPQGFMARFHARRARPPRSEWVFLPPMARPIAFALSCGVVALVVWDKTVTTPEPAPMHSLNEAAVATTKSAPVAQLDFANRISPATGASAAGSSALEVSGIAGPASEPARRGDIAPRLAEADTLATQTQPERKTLSRQARARGGPTDGLMTTERGLVVMSEEARSARNEQMFDFIETQKKKMGIARVVAKDEVISGLNSPAMAPKIGAVAPVLFKGVGAAQPAERELEDKPTATQETGRLSSDAGLVFSDGHSLASSWVLLGFPGQPPTVDFSLNRVVLIKPSAARILSVTPKPGSINVVFRTLSPEEAPDPAADRAAVIPREPRAVLLFDASPR